MEDARYKRKAQRPRGAARRALRYNGANPEARMYSHTIGARRYIFPDLKTLLAKATPPRSGDRLAGLAAESGEERVAAQYALADLPLTAFLDAPVVPYESDEVTRLIVDSHDAAAFAPVAHLTVGGFRDWLLSDEATTAALTALAPGVTPEMAAAVSKISRLQDLMVMAAKCTVVTRFRDTVGLPGRLSVRLQPNHPTDDARGIAASILDGLLLGAGDAVIGINPATDSPERAHRLLSMLEDIRVKLDIPTQACVLAHVTTTLELIGRGAPVDLVFQSIAGTQAANKSFGIDLALAGRGARSGAFASARHGRRQRDVFRDRPRQRALGQRPSRRRPADAGSARLCGGAGLQAAARQYAWSASSDRNIFSTASRSCAPGWRIISAASSWACRWASTSATPITRKPTRTTWTRCWPCWRRPASISSWACPAPTTSCSATRAPRSTTRWPCAISSASGRRRNSKPGCNGRA